jgi:Flp pilus assembly protein TadG
MIADRLTKHSSRRRDERGVALVLIAMSMVTLLIIAALVIDVGRMRSRGQSMQSAADLSALAAAAGLRNSDVGAACQAAVNYFNSNVSTSSSITASTFCAQSGNDVTTTTCSGGTLGEAKPSATVNGITLSIHYPVPASEITSPGIVGARSNDGTPCQRLSVLITDTQPGFFSGLAGHASLSGTRSATIRVLPGHSTKAPALWLLDPTGCTSLQVGGGSYVTVGNAAVASGLITVDSDGTACSSNQKTISTGGSNTLIDAVGTGTNDPGMITLDALPGGSSTCVTPACDPSDVSSGLIVPQPIPAGQRATRAPVDWQFNCKGTYPNYHGIGISGCQDGTPAYVDLLKSAVGTTGLPGTTFKSYKGNGFNCNPSGTVNVPAGNWLVDCTGQGLKIGNGSNVTFAGGNVVFDNGVSMTGGTLSFNTSNPTSSLPSSCVPPNITTTLCIDNSSSNAAFVYFRSGNITMTGGTLTALGVSVFDNFGYLKSSANPPMWHAPTEGPFAGLAFWSDFSSSQYQVNGGSGASLTGIFFAPEAVPFTLAGGGNWGQQAAQFISYQLVVTGNSTLQITPNQQAVRIVPPMTALIR